MIDIIQERTWQGFKHQTVLIHGNHNNKVPCHILLPNTHTSPLPFLIATHGATSSKHEWLEFDGYTKGGNLSQKLLSQGIAIIAMDWHYHGENDTQNLNGRNVFEPEHFIDFFERSLLDAETVINYAKQNPLFDPKKMGFAGYSLAGTFGFWLANHGVDFKTMLLCVPGANRQSDQYYSGHNNLDNLHNVSILQISAEADEYIDFNESKWLFAKLPITHKKFLSYNSGHSLPVDYVAEAENWFKAELI